MGAQTSVERTSVRPLRRSLHRPVVLLCLLIVVVQSFLLVALVRDPGTGEPHHVPLAISAPGVVAWSLAEEANALPGEPFSATPLPSTDPVDGLVHARSAVGDGSSVASLVVDLRGTRDVLVVNPGRDTRLNDSVIARVRSVEAGYRRTVDVEYTNRTAPGNTTLVGAADPENPYDFTLAASLVGFLLVLVISLVRGPVAPTVRQGVRRVTVVVGLALLAGPLLVLLPGTSLPGPGIQLAALGALSVAAAALSTLALEALAGLAGLTLAAALFFVLATPLLTRTDAYLLPPAWGAFAPWTRTGATLDAANAIASSYRSQVVQPVLVLAVWLVLAATLLLVAERTRTRLGLDPTSHRSGRAPGTTSRSAPGTTPTREPGRHRLWRLQVLATVVPLAVILGAAVAFVPRGSDVARAAAPHGASQTTCVATGPVRTVADLNRIAGRFRGSPEFQGGDVGADVLLQDGRRLWVFGDTLRADDFDGQRLVRNSMLVVDSDCLRVVLPDDHGALIPDRSDGVGYWPMSIGRTEMPGYDLVSVATQRVRSTGTTAFSFENLGTSIAVFVVRRGSTPQLIAHHDIGPDAVDRSRPTWGAATVVRDGWVYLYGTANPGDDYVFGYSLRVARMRPDDILDPSTWRYWSGRSWVRDPQKATELIPAPGGVSQTLSVFERDGTWYALSKRDEFLGTDLTIWTAPAPTGPFGTGRTVAKLPSDTVTGELRYMPLAHPDLLPRQGTMVVSYSRNTTDAAAVGRNPLLYRPQFMRVDLP